MIDPIQSLLRYVSWSTLFWAAVTLTGIFFAWQIAISRRLFVYEKWQSAVFWITSSVGWLFFVWQTTSHLSFGVLPILTLIVVSITSVVGVLYLMLRAPDVESLLTGFGLALVLFGVIGALASARADHGWAILLGSLGGVTVGQAIAGILFVTEVRKPPIALRRTKTVERI